MGWIVSGVLLMALVLVARRKPKPPVVLGVHDEKCKTVWWISKPAKTWWDELMEWLPAAFWAYGLGAASMWVMLAITQG